MSHFVNEPWPGLPAPHLHTLVTIWEKRPWMPWLVYWLVMQVSVAFDPKSRNRWRLRRLVMREVKR